ncbi:MAG: hypothetical protein JNJ78_16410, partial [Anaerolineae bacterium]|nr:hypothetical protein [Anaerolineae bacterium]
RTRPLGPEATVALGRLRQLMKYVRACMTSANDILHGDTPTVPLSSYTSEGFILYSVGEIRSSVQEIMQTVAEIQRDELLRYTPMPGSNGRMAGAVAADIQQYMLEIKEILDFAQQYAERRARLNRTLASC